MIGFTAEEGSLTASLPLLLGATGDCWPFIFLDHGLILDSDKCRISAVPLRRS